MAGCASRFCIEIEAMAGLLVTSVGAAAPNPERELADSLSRAGDNRAQIQQALQEVPERQRIGMRFMIKHMPTRDLTTLSSKFLTRNVDLAYRAWQEAPWSKSIPQEIFLNNILPYANINEKRDDWRGRFYEQFKPVVKDAVSPAHAAALLNQKIFPMLKVRYSRKRRRADQGPFESIESGLASCTGLTILLVDACRAVGVPARFAGTPLWSDKSGNHSWVEVWDRGWHFTGAAEPSGDQLDRAWFISRASRAKRDHRQHAIYAVSYKKTPQSFPLVWDPRIDYVHAVNVTDRYTQSKQPLPQGSGRAFFRFVDKARRERRAVAIKVLDGAGKELFAGQTKDERFDGNDHLTVPLLLNREYRVEVTLGKRKQTQKVTLRRDAQLFTLSEEGR